MTASNVVCPECQEVQSSDNLRCARCGISLETKEQRKVRLAALEQERRQAERSDVSIQRLPGFGVNGSAPAFGTRKYLDNMSNQRRRRIVFALLVGAVVFVVLVNA
jgi:hypothetical protein